MQGILAPGGQGPSGYQPRLAPPGQHTTAHRRPDETRAIRPVSPEPESTGESLCVRQAQSRVHAVLTPVCDQRCASTVLSHVREWVSACASTQLRGRGPHSHAEGAAHRAHQPGGSTASSLNSSLHAPTGCPSLQPLPLNVGRDSGGGPRCIPTKFIPIFPLISKSLVATVELARFASCPASALLVS